MGIKVCKFGGSSLADAAHFQRVRDILLADPQRRFVVASAPGKRDKADEKVTDLLYQCYRAVERKQPAEEIFARVAGRYMDIANALGLENGMQKVLEDTFAEIVRQKSPDFTASRGEYLNAFLLARYLGWDFIDAKDYVKFDRQGVFASEWTNEILAAALREHECAVLPGFYGSLPNGEIHTFSRGGSDISGAIVARAAEAEIYENWTDVSGFLMADPRIVENPQPIDVLTYRELRELSYMGATVLHEDAIFPVHRAGIPTAIKQHQRAGRTRYADRRRTGGSLLPPADHRHRGPQGFHADLHRKGHDEQRSWGLAGACCRRWRISAFRLSTCPRGSTPCAWSFHDRELHIHARANSCSRIRET